MKDEQTGEWKPPLPEFYDLRRRLREAEAENAELKEVLKAQVVAACNERITALEEAARPVCEWMKARPGEGLPNLRACVKRLAEVLALCH